MSKFANGCPHCQNNHDPGIQCRFEDLLTGMEIEALLYLVSLAQTDPFVRVNTFANQNNLTANEAYNVIANAGAKLRKRL